MDDSEFEKAKTNGRRWWTTWAEANDALGRPEAVEVEAVPPSSSSASPIELDVEIDTPDRSRAPAIGGEGGSGGVDDRRGNEIESEIRRAIEEAFRPFLPSLSTDYYSQPSSDSGSDTPQRSPDWRYLAHPSSPSHPNPNPLHSTSPTHSSSSSSHYAYAGSISPFWLLTLGATGILAATLLSRWRARKQSKVLQGLREDVRRGNAELLGELRGLVGREKVANETVLDPKPFEQLKSDLLTCLPPLLVHRPTPNTPDTDLRRAISQLDSFRTDVATRFTSHSTALESIRVEMTKLRESVDALALNSAAAAVATAQAVGGISSDSTTTMTDVGSESNVNGGPIKSFWKMDAEVDGDANGSSSAQDRSTNGTTSQATTSQQDRENHLQDLLRGFARDQTVYVKAHEMDDIDRTIGVYRKTSRDKPSNAEDRLQELLRAANPLAQRQTAEGRLQSLLRDFAKDHQVYADAHGMLDMMDKTIEVLTKPLKETSSSPEEDRLQGLLRDFARDRKFYEDSHEMFDIDKTIESFRKKHQEIRDEMGKQ